ncbi:MAG: Mth938-like domain-containing protein [Burkholderiales bacterium]
MKLHLSRFTGQNAFSGYGEDYVTINGQRHAHSVLVLPDELRDWPALILDESAFAPLMDLPVEILLLGTGRKLRFPHPSIAVSFRQKGIGLEVMDTPAACRTYNILLSEARKVAAAIFIEAAPTP